MIQRYEPVRVVRVTGDNEINPEGQFISIQMRQVTNGREHYLMLTVRDLNDLLNMIGEAFK